MVLIHQLPQYLAVPLLDGGTGSYYDLAYPLKEELVPLGL